MAAWIASSILMMASLGFAAHAADAPPSMKSPFGFTGAMQAQPVSEPSAMTRAMDTAWSILLFEQHRLTQDMTGAVRNLKSTTNIAAATGALVVVSFIYGILHAVGPGHGKAVISSYMLADNETLRRGIFLAFLSSLIQALSAIMLIGGLYAASLATGLQTKWAEAWLETLSWGFVAALGAWLMFKQIRPLFQRRPVAASHVPHHGDHDHARHDHAHHDHFHSDACHVHQCSGEHAHGPHPHELSAAPTHPHSDDHDHDHVHDEHCGHAHLPGPDELRGKLSWSRAFAIAFSIGIRPCTGALLVIIFAATQGLIWAGILATFAMAFGTALTVSGLAALSVGSRNLAIALAGAESRWGNFVARSASILSSAAVFILGTVFFFASFHDVRPF
ncbi:MAG TPA: nickel/cobalt transporter [Hyphomicrobium sp.]|nr:nickel/cobalt transporter [Hyphomicrobium sp.]